MADHQRPTVMPAVIGIAITCIFLVVLGYLAQRRAAQQDAIPQLTITTPVPNTAVDSPLVIRFTSTAAIALSPSGWGYRTMHVHAWLDDVQSMPAAADIRRIGHSAYEWTLPAVRRGSSLRVRLGWADASHRALPQGTTQEVPYVVQ